MLTVLMLLGSVFFMGFGCGVVVMEMVMTRRFKLFLAQKQKERIKSLFPNND